MPTIPYMQGVSIGTKATFSFPTPPDDPRRLEAQRQALASVNAAADVVVPASLGKLLRKAGISPPPAGQTLALKDVDAALLAGGLNLDQRIDVKSGLGRLGFLQRGNPVKI